MKLNKYIKNACLIIDWTQKTRRMPALKRKSTDEIPSESLNPLCIHVSLGKELEYRISVERKCQDVIFCF
jgi:hypothetical protein